MYCRSGDRGRTAEAVGSRRQGAPAPSDTSFVFWTTSQAREKAARSVGPRARICNRLGPARSSSCAASAALSRRNRRSMARPRRVPGSLHALVRFGPPWSAFGLLLVCFASRAHGAPVDERGGGLRPSWRRDKRSGEAEVSGRMTAAPAPVYTLGRDRRASQPAALSLLPARPPAAGSSSRRRRPRRCWCRPCRPVGVDLR